MVRMVILSLVLMLFGAVTPALSHPPGEILLEFDVAEHLLKVSVAHAVSDSSRHYVDQIAVELKGEKMIEQKFKSQSDRRAQVVEYRLLDARPGDEIAVTARCNISGQKKATVIVKEKRVEQDVQEQSSTEN